MLVWICRLGPHEVIPIGCDGWFCIALDTLDFEPSLLPVGGPSHLGRSIADYPENSTTVHSSHLSSLSDPKLTTYISFGVGTVISRMPSMESRDRLATIFIQNAIAANVRTTIITSSQEKNDAASSSTSTDSNESHSHNQTSG